MSRATEAADASTTRRWQWGLSPNRIGVAIAIGVVVGLATAASNAWPSVWTYLLNSGWVWAGLMVAGGLVALRPLGGMVTAFLAEIFACAVYYLGDWWWAGTHTTSAAFGHYLPELQHWVIIAFLLSPGLGTVGVLARRRDLLGFFATLVVPLGASAEMLLHTRWAPAAESGEEFVRWGVWAGSLLVAAWALWRYLRARGSRDARVRPIASRRERRLVTTLAIVSLVVGGAFVLYAVS